jgi:hypothetical protein
MQIEKLTLDQENQVSQYRNKWEEIALTETFDRSRAKESVELTYSILNLSTPDILFVSSPKSAVETVVSQDFGNPLSEVIALQLVQNQLDRLPNYIHQSLLYDLNKRFCFLLNAKLCSIEQANESMLDRVIEKLPRNNRSQIKNCIKPSVFQWIPQAALLDFCISVLHCDCDKIYLDALKLILQHCGWVYPFKRGCIVCERPKQIVLEPGTDFQQAKTTLLYGDGQEVQYSYNDTTSFHWRGKIVQMMYKKYES